MAAKVNPEIFADARTEHRREKKKFDDKIIEQNPANEKPPGESEQTPPTPPKLDANTTEQTPPTPPQPEPVDEFKKKYDEYFKGLDGLIAGDMVINLVDDLKTNFFYLWAKKNKIENVQKQDLQMDEKSKKFAAFLVDHAIQNNFFDIIKKYPLLAALGVIVISGGGTFAMLNMLKQSTKQGADKDSEIEKLKKELADLKAGDTTISQAREVLTTT